MKVTMKKTALVVVAHPDDETIWMGGTLLSKADEWDTTIISLCRMYDKDRSTKFRKACRMLKARCFISDIEDERLDDVPTEDIIKRIKAHSKRSYDYIFTHGKNGEYGHKRHIEVNKAVIEMLEKKMLSSKKIFFFSYVKKGNACYANKGNKRSGKFINIGLPIFKRKKELIHDVYGFQKNSFEYICCKDKEAFEIREVI